MGVNKYRETYTLGGNTKYSKNNVLKQSKILNRFNTISKQISTGFCFCNRFKVF